MVFSVRYNLTSLVCKRVRFDYRAVAGCVYADGDAHTPFRSNTRSPHTRCISNRDSANPD